MGWDEINRLRIVPGGCVTVKDAFNVIGKVVLDREETKPGNRWSGEEAAYRDLGIRPAPAHQVFWPDSDIVKNRVLFDRDKGQVASLLGIDPKTHTAGYTYNDWCRATDVWKQWEGEGPAIERRRTNTLALMQRLAMTERLKFVSFEPEKGKITPVKKECWNCETAHALDRLTYAALNSHPDWIMCRPTNGGDRKEYIARFDIQMFVDGASLNSLLAQLDSEAALAHESDGAWEGDLSDRILREFRAGKSEKSAEASIVQSPKPTAIQPGPGRGRRRGTGVDDTAYIQAIHHLVGTGISAWKAAEQVAADLKGGGTPGAIQRRLHKKYQKEHGNSPD